MKNLKFNFDNAIMQTWRKCLQIEMLILYERADYTPEGLEEFTDCFYSYLEDAMRNGEELESLRRKFRYETNLHLDEVKLSGTPINKAIKSTQALCIEIGAIILWFVGEWQKENIRQFVYKCWDSFKNYSSLYPQIIKMQNETGIRVSVKRGH